MSDTDTSIPFAHRYIELPSFDLLGFTKIVKSGGELYSTVRNDGRWELLKQLAASDKSIYGVASLDKACPKDYYRYTIAIMKTLNYKGNKTYDDQLFPFHVKKSKWIVFMLDHFAMQYGEFWQLDPYKMIAKLGFSFNKALSIHIDVFPETYITDNDKMEFWMPVQS